MINAGSGRISCGSSPSKRGVKATFFCAAAYLLPRTSIILSRDGQARQSAFGQVRGGPSGTSMGRVLNLVADAPSALGKMSPGLPAKSDPAARRRRG